MYKPWLLLAGMLMPLTMFAAEIYIGDGYFLKGAEKTPGDIYVASDSALFSGSVSGDAIAAARTITSDGTIDEDALFIGETVVVSGRVSDDLRVIGGTARIQGAVLGDIVAIGASVSLAPEAAIAGNLYAIGGEVIIDGKVSGEVKAAGGNVRLTGSVGDSFEVWGDDVALSPAAAIGGDFIHHGAREARVAKGARVGGEMLFDKQEGGSVGLIASFASGLFPFQLLMGLAGAFFLFLLFRERSEEILLDAFENFWRRVLRGLLLFIILPLASAFLLFTVVGIPLGIAFAALYLAGIILASACAGMLLGVALERPLFRRQAFPLSVRPVFVGTALLALLGALPYIGLVVVFIFTLASFGALGTIGWRNLKQMP